jgi:hypothetical protein
LTQKSDLAIFLNCESSLNKWKAAFIVAAAKKTGKTLCIEQPAGLCRGLYKKKTIRKKKTLK